MTPRLLCAGLALVALAGSPGPLRAHTRSVSHSSWELTEAGASVRVQVTLLDLSRLSVDPVLSEETARSVGLYLAERLRLFADGEPCAVIGGPTSRRAPRGSAAWAWRLSCPSAGRLSIRSTLLLEVAAGHLHFARLRFPDGRGVEKVLSEAVTRRELAAPAGTDGAPAVGSTLADYLWVGIRHILSGWDHLAFVIALLLLARTLGEVATLVTGFTLAHGVTLGLAVLGLLAPEARTVEALIGFSIALVGAENAWLLSDRDRRIPGAIVLGLLGLAGLAALGVGVLHSSCSASRSSRAATSVCSPGSGVPRVCGWPWRSPSGWFTALASAAF
ncbi:MAG: HupE/UreJ family protein [Myxococcota bacterium]